MKKISKTPDVFDHTTESIVALSVRQSKPRLTPSAEDGFAAIIKAWNVSDEDAQDLLGGISSDLYAAMKDTTPHEVLSEEALIRISYLVGIFKALHTVFGSRVADTWMTLPNSNPMFGGETPLAYCLVHGIDGLKNVRKLLEARCQGY
ncbi:MAG: MbcA/ParS/Xre antitoxin family protein [Acidobacteria bacterium]|jgi:hypothetical protein|nr:MbcA/ParS/Xre antitoxin family protein [Acidobacteriota bacterium]